MKMELQSLQSSLIPNHFSRKSAPKTCLRRRKDKLNVGIPTPARAHRFEVFSGQPTPFGATARDGGVNFAVSSGNASSATLCLINLSYLPEKRVTEQIALDSTTNKTGDAVVSRGEYGALGPDEECWPQMACVVPSINDEVNVFLGTIQGRPLFCVSFKLSSFSTSYLADLNYKDNVLWNKEKRIKGEHESSILLSLQYHL
ncbi:UNVERIFIED_CONTAM: Isoamylase 1, chloroplastic [Sesamum calycinum]|uniref:Isoamylase 1, chloroplastic n=1 Tax=Sesamum calycinum TaxID=2727403 RepID=A0AAW2SZS8_9LAMI